MAGLWSPKADEHVASPHPMPPPTPVKASPQGRRDSWGRHPCLGLQTLLQPSARCLTLVPGNPPHVPLVDPSMTCHRATHQEVSSWPSAGVMDSSKLGLETPLYGKLFLTPLTHSLLTTLTVPTLQRTLGLRRVNNLPKGTELSQNLNSDHLTLGPMIIANGMGCRGHRGLRAVP